MVIDRVMYALPCGQHLLQVNNLDQVRHMKRGKMDALGSDRPCPWNFPAWCVSVWLAVDFFLETWARGTSAGWIDGEQCQTPPASPPSVQNLTKHFSQLQTRLYTFKKNLFACFFTFFFFLLKSFMRSVSCYRWLSCRTFRKQLANSHLTLVWRLHCCTGPCIVFNLLHAFEHTACWHEEPDPINTNSYHERTHSLSCSLSSTVHSVFLPLSSHLRHFSCHSWKHTMEIAHTCNLALWPKRFPKLVHWLYMKGFYFFSFSSPFFSFALQPQQHLFLFRPQSSNSTVF